MSPASSLISIILLAIPPVPQVHSGILQSPSVQVNYLKVHDINLISHLDCHSSCANCTAGSNTSCVSCPSSSYFTALNGTCTKSCYSPYAANTQTKTCELQITSAQSLDTTLQSMMNDALSSNLTNEEKGDYLNTLSSTIENFYSDNYGMNNDTSSSAACSTCSGNGESQYDSVYLTKKCHCSDGWTGECCSISNTDAASIQNLKTQIINQIAQTPLSLTVASNWTQPYLDTLLSLINPSYCSLSDVQSSMKIVANIINTDFTQKTANDIFDKDKMEVTVQIIDSCLICVYKTDCLLSAISSQEIYNSSIDLLTKLSVLQLWQKAPDSGTYTLDSTNVLVLSERVSLSNLNGHTIEPPGYPKIVFQQKTPATSSSGAADIQLIIWKTNLLACPNIQKENNSPPPVSVSLNEPDTLNPSSAQNQLSAQISFPISAGQTYSNCSTGCKASVSGGYLNCDCQSLSSLSATTQMKGFFEQSNIYKLAMASALATFDYLHAWPFWILWGLLVWIVLTFVCLKFRIIRPLRYNVRFDKSSGTVRMPDTKRLNLGFFRALFYGLKVLFLISRDRQSLIIFL